MGSRLGRGGATIAAPATGTFGAAWRYAIVVATIALLLVLAPIRSARASHLSCEGEATTSSSFDGTNFADLGRSGLTTREVSSWLDGGDSFSAQGGNDGTDSIHGGPDADNMHGGPDGDVLREELGGSGAVADGDCGNDTVYDGPGDGEALLGGECGESGSADLPRDCDDGSTNEDWLEFEGSFVTSSAYC